MAFFCLLTIHLHFPDTGDLKGKRKQLKSLKDQLRRRFGAAVAETDHHDKWQRSTLSVALVGRDRRVVEESADAVRRFAEFKVGDGVRCERAILSTDDLAGG